MKHRFSRNSVLLVLTLTSLLFLAVLVVAQDEPVSTEEAETEIVDEALIERGEYLVSIARCVSCHTPRLEEFGSDELSTDQRVTLSLRGFDVLDTENRYLAGGRTFNLGPAGAVVGGNLTPDEETGIGLWTDEELEIAIRLGVRRDGTLMHRIMPSSSYNNWAADDMQAVIAYLRSIPAIENDAGESTILRDDYEGDPIEALAEAEFPAESPSDPIVRGEYLVVDVMRCTGCHTPRDPDTGRSDSTRYLGGGQAYEGEWGIVYGGNISPHAATGIGAWSDQEIERVFREGIRVDGRRLIFMPWQDYSSIADEDLMATIAYLRSVEAIDNEVPLPAINDDFVEMADSDE